MAQDSGQPIPASRLNLLEKATTQYAGEVLGALDWLTSRGIELGTAATFRLGVVVEPLPGHERYAGRLAIPYMNASGTVVTLRFRCLLPHSCHDVGCPKYLTMPGDDVRLFNTKALLTTRPALHVTEGEFDAMVLTQMGYDAVAAPGVSSWQPHHTVMCGGFNAIYIWGDGDQAGITFNDAMTERLSAARPVKLPQGHDISSLYVSEGSEAIQQLHQRTEELYQ